MGRQPWALSWPDKELCLRAGEGPKPHPHDSTLGESSREAQSGRRLLGTFYWVQTTFLGLPSWRPWEASALCPGLDFIQAFITLFFCFFPPGEIASVQGTAFDLRKPVELGKHLQEFHVNGFDGWWREGGCGNQGRVLVGGRQSRLGALVLKDQAGLVGLC